MVKRAIDTFDARYIVYGLTVRVKLLVVDVARNFPRIAFLFTTGGSHQYQKARPPILMRFASAWRWVSSIEILTGIS